MKALILAAGRGSRLVPLTDDCPKPMLPIADVPMLERIMGGIAQAAAISKFVLVTGYRAEVIREHFGDGARWGWQVEYVHQEIPGGVGDAVSCAGEWLRGGPFLMTYGDIMLDPANYARFAARSLDKEASPVQALVGVNWVEDPYRGAAVYLDTAGRVMRIEEKPPRGTAATHWNNAGLFVFDPVILGYAARLQSSPRGERELPDAITAMIADGYVVLGLPLEGAWRDVGTQQDYMAINAEFGEASSP